MDGGLISEFSLNEVNSSKSSEKPKQNKNNKKYYNNKCRGIIKV